MQHRKHDSFSSSLQPPSQKLHASFTVRARFCVLWRNLWIFVHVHLASALLLRTRLLLSL
jgi:hypothetical protein